MQWDTFWVMMIETNSGGEAIPGIVMGVEVWGDVEYRSAAFHIQILQNDLYMHIMIVIEQKLGMYAARE